METERTQSYINSLKEMILDESRIVTYISASKELCIHVNESKVVLLKTLEDIRKTYPQRQLNVCFLISGITEDGKALTTVCREDEQKEIQDRFKFVFCSHIYSVNEGTGVADHVALLNINKVDDLILCTGLVKNNLCVKHTSGEFENLKSKVQITSNSDLKPSGQSTKIKQETKNKHTEINGEQHVNVTRVLQTKSEPAVKSEPPESPQKRIISEKHMPKTKSENKNGLKAQKGIAGFFAKSSSLPNKVKPNAVNQNEINTPNKDKAPSRIKEECIDMEVDELEAKPNKLLKEEPVKNGFGDSNKPIKNHSLKQIKKTAKVDSKRKRVLHVSDSESEEDPFNEEPGVKESDDEIPPTPSVDTVKITSGIVNPKKRRKVVDKTYTDEYGYMLTKKEEVYESCSENEELIDAEENTKQTSNNTLNDPKPNKNETSPEDKTTDSSKVAKKKKALPPQKGQQTLMNFFKKK